MQRVASTLVLAAFMSGCAHTTPNPVPVSQVGDDTMSCQTIKKQMGEMTAQAKESDSDGNNQVAGNVALGVAGAFLLVPWFFMDTGNAHTVEAKAAIARYRRLQDLYQDRGCAAADEARQAAAQAPAKSAPAPAVAGHRPVATPAP